MRYRPRGAPFFLRKKRAGFALRRALPARFAAAKRRKQRQRPQSGSPDGKAVRVCAANRKRARKPSASLLADRLPNPFSSRLPRLKPQPITMHDWFSVSLLTQKRNVSPIVFLTLRSPDPPRSPQQPLLPLPCQRAQRPQCGCPRPRASGVRPAWCGRTRGWNPRPCG